MKSKFLGLVAVALLAGPMAAQAVPIVHTATCVDSTNVCATGISGLESSGEIFDVTFVTGSSYNAVFAANDPYFLGDSVGALAARDAIVAAFGVAIYGIVGEGGGVQSSRFLIPYLATSGGNNGAFGSSDRGSTSWAVTTYGTTNDNDFSAYEPGFFTAYAVFEKVSVPEPTSLGLFCLGLVGLGLSRRRKTH